MAMRIPLVALALFAGAASASAETCTRYTEFMPRLCPLHLPAIASIAILENARVSSDTDHDCRHFVFTPESVRRYLGKARKMEARDVHYYVDWSPCSVSGTLTTVDGRTAEFEINEGTHATIAFAPRTPAEPAPPVLDTYCPTCRFKPFGNGF